MQFGKYKIDLVDTGIFALDGGAMFGVVPKALWSKAYNAGDEANRIPLSARPLLVRWDEKVLLIDTGNGTKMSDKLAKIYGIDLDKSSMECALKPFDVKQEDITDVILTHLHFDHAGGATIFENSDIVPTFKNAKYYVQQKHFEWAQNPSDKDRASFFKENYMPLKSNGFLELIDGEADIFAGIKVIPVNGHTSNMQIVKIIENDQSLLYCADLCPTSAHINPNYVMGYDNSPLIGIEEKKYFMGRAYEENTILVYEHDAFIQASRVEVTERGFKAGEVITISPNGEKFEL